METMRLGAVLRLADKKEICAENTINNNKFCLDRARAGTSWNALPESSVVKRNINTLKCLQQWRYQCMSFRGMRHMVLFSFINIISVSCHSFAFFQNKNSHIILQGSDKFICFRRLLRLQSDCVILSPVTFASFLHWNTSKCFVNARRLNTRLLRNC